MEGIKYLLTGLLGCCFTSCIVDIWTNEELVADTDRLVFTSNLTTKGMIIDDTTLDSLGVCAYETGGYDFYNESSVPNFMYNQLLVRGRSASANQKNWTYSPDRFWPDKDSQKLSFFAYAPHTQPWNGLTLSEPERGGVPQISYTVPLDVTHQPDLLVAFPQMNLTKKDGPVELFFKHTLACISFYMEGAGKQIRGIAVTGIKTSGTLSLGLESDGKIGSTYDYMIRWNLSDEISESDYSAGLQLDEGKDYLTTTDGITNLLRENGYLMMLPQRLTADAKILLTLADGSQTEFPLNAMTDRWQAGVRYQYKFKGKNL